MIEISSQKSLLTKLKNLKIPSFNLDKFSNIEKILSKNKVKINGLILDLGVSNTQLNNPSEDFPLVITDLLTCEWTKIQN